MICDLDVYLHDRGICPCGSVLFHPGPRGGMAHNIKCAGCGQCYWWSPPFRPYTIDESPGAYPAHSMTLLAILIAARLQ